MTNRRLLIGLWSLVSWSLVSSSCSNDSVEVTDPDEPAAVAGTFKGPYSNTRSTTTYQATLVLAQAGRNVTGSFTSTDVIRSSSVVGTVAGDKITATFTLDGNCAGSYFVEIDVTQGGSTLLGAFTLSDCIGMTSGAFTLTKQ